MKRSHILLFSFGVSVLVLALIQISLSNLLSTGGIQIAAMQQELLSYQKQNAELKEQIYSISSFTYLSEEASKKGFVSSDTHTAFVVEGAPPLAIKP